jgi:hypothetical protein
LRHRNDHSLPDIWAERASDEVSGLLGNLHDDLRKSWICDCDESHVRVQGSFISQSETGKIDCKLFFCPELRPDQPWRTTDVVLLDPVVQQRQKIFGNATDRLTSTFSHEILSQGEPTHRIKLLSLEEWITTSKPYPIRDTSLKARLALALLLCYAFLDLGGGHWWHYRKGTVDVYLLWVDDDVELSLLRPYFLTRVDEDEDFDENYGRDCIPGQERNFWMPTLPTLGKLILELLTGENIDGMVSWMLSRPTMQATRTETCVQQPSRLV